jgi:hypothetical protein
MAGHDPISPLPPFAAFVGIDWADRKHDVCLLDLETRQREHVVLAHTPEAIDAWACQLRDRFGARPEPVALALERCYRLVGPWYNQWHDASAKIRQSADAGKVALRTKLAALDRRSLVVLGDPTVCLPPPPLRAAPSPARIASEG